MNKPSSDRDPSSRSTIRNLLGAARLADFPSRLRARRDGDIRLFFGAFSTRRRLLMQSIRDVLFDSGLVAAFGLGRSCDDSACL